MSQTKKIPATIVTGFLGAGKTTLIRHLIANAGGRRLALIVNEFGELGFDGELLKGCSSDTCREEDIVELANGCICCTVADDFLPTMEALLSRPQLPDHIIIETSGLALPKPLVQAFDWPSIRTRVTVDGVVAVIDADATAAGRFATDPELLAAQRAADPNFDHDAPLEELFHDQLACADLVVLTKTDLLDAAAIDAAQSQLDQFTRPGVKTVKASFGELPAAVLLGLGAAAEDDVAGRKSVHDGEGEHDHDDFDSFVVKGGEVESVDPLLHALTRLIVAHDILRVKGMVAVHGKPARLVIQAVGPRIQHHYDRSWKADEARISQLVVIGQKGLDEAAIALALKAALGAGTR